MEQEAFAGPVAGAVTVWDAQTAIALGRFIQRHYAACPPPVDDPFAERVRQWGEEMLAAGAAHLTRLVETGAVLSVLP